MLLLSESRIRWMDQNCSHQIRKISMKLLICEVLEMREILSLVFLQMRMPTSQNGSLIFRTYRMHTKIKFHLICQKLMQVTVSLLLKLQLFWAHRHRRNDRVVVLRKSQILRKKNQKNERLNVVIRVE